MLTKKLVYLILGACCLIGCRTRPALPPTIPAAWLTETPTRVPAIVQPNATLQATPTLSAEIAPLPTSLPATNPPPAAAETAISLSAAPGVPAELVAEVQAFANRNDGFVWQATYGQTPNSAEIVLTPHDGLPFARWIYAAAAPFATIPDNLTLAELTSGQTQAGTLVLSAETAASFPQFAAQPVEMLDADALWAQRPAVGLLPVDALTPDLKLLSVDGQSPLTANFSAESYPLALSIGVAGDPVSAEVFRSAWDGPTSNFDPSKLTTIAMTGVTALVRATAYNMELNGMLWPGTDIKVPLQAADFAHISNEVAFAADCPYPNPIGGTTFCSGDNTFALLQDIGTDIVELTGNHVNDWGQENLVRSIEMYEQAGMQTFGGGRNLAEAQQPLLLTHNGNRIALVGCNSFGPAFAFATELGAGSRPCGPDVAAQISQLREEGHLVIATLQYTEFYHYAPTPQQQTDFRALIDAGASAVSGSQAHHVQTFELYQDGFIHYGPGNTFFDQMDQLGTRQTFVDTYAIYDGELINVALWTGLIENYAKPRLMTSAERAQTLQTLFSASGW